MTIEEIASAEADRIQEEARDEARDRALYRATFEVIDEDQLPLTWRCKICGAALADDWAKAIEEYVDVHGLGPLEWWWTP